MRNCWVIWIALICSTGHVAAQEKHFDGFYIAVDTGIRSAKTIDHAGEQFRTGNKLYYAGAVGWRKQSDEDWVFGLEGTFGDIQGFQHQFFANGLSTARVRNVWSANGYIGRVFGKKKRNLILAGGGYASMRAGFNAVFNGAVFRPSEPGGGYRAFFGYERALFRSIHLRLQGSYFDFGNQVDTFIGTAGLSVNF